ncbi:hypothetical protein V6R21_02770 [Limibacter armeniacum]|uniref:hypothetical protein n=1 Tax=Limibacter armeniacum TaxID=466084 RepID=UPI002FE6779D
MNLIFNKYFFDSNKRERIKTSQTSTSIDIVKNINSYDWTVSINLVTKYLSENELLEDSNTIFELIDRTENLEMQVTSYDIGVFDISINRNNLLHNGSYSLKSTQKFLRMIIEGNYKLAVDFFRTEPTIPQGKNQLHIQKAKIDTAIIHSENLLKDVNVLQEKIGKKEKSNNIIGLIVVSIIVIIILLRELL